MSKKKKKKIGGSKVAFLFLLQHELHKLFIITHNLLVFFF